MNLFAPQLRRLTTWLAKQSSVQRAGFFVAVLSLLVIFVLHNPVDGYTFMYDPGYGQDRFQTFAITNKVSDRDRACDSLFREISKLLDGLQSVDNAKYEEFASVSNHLHRLGCTGKQFYPFRKWQSDEPLVDWFGSVVHIFWAIGLILIALVVWLFTFRTAQPPSSDGHAP